MKNKIKVRVSFSSHRKRKTALSTVICVLEQVSSAEESYRDKLPCDTLYNTLYDSAEHNLLLLGEAINLLRSVYEPIIKSERGVPYALT